MGRELVTSICLFVCLHSKRKTAWAISTKLGTHILYSSRSACIDPKVRRSKVKSDGYEKRHGHMVAGDVYSFGSLLLLLASACRYDCVCCLVIYFVIAVDVWLGSCKLLQAVAGRMQLRFFTRNHSAAILAHRTSHWRTTGNAFPISEEARLVCHSFNPKYFFCRFWWHVQDHSLGIVYSLSVEQTITHIGTYHAHAGWMVVLLGKHGFISCFLNFFTPVVPNLSVLLGQMKSFHILLVTISSYRLICRRIETAEWNAQFRSLSLWGQNLAFSVDQSGHCLISLQL